MAIIIQKPQGLIFHPNRAKLHKTMVKNTWFDWKSSGETEKPGGLMKKNSRFFGCSDHFDRGDPCSRPKNP